ncbi:MAG: DUF2304 family protein [Nanoarchaeota archaeon]|nr:DUF2304 family protein [Nanoarchaeota archaeon]MBU1051199.1 DUF2304 family protein [Nanoarchaeota archaeon]
MTVQWVVLAFVAIMIVKLTLDLRRSKISESKFIMWAVIWLALAIIAFFPEIVFFLAGLIGIERAKDLPIYLSIILLFYLVFKIGIKIENINHEITRLVKKLALEKHKK